MKVVIRREGAADEVKDVQLDEQLPLRSALASLCGDAACNRAKAAFELAGGRQVPVTDLSAPAGSALAALPSPPLALITTLPAISKGTSSSPSSSKWQGHAHTAKRLLLAVVKVVVAVELTVFGLERLRLARYLGRRQVWGGRSSDDYTSEESEGGTSSEAAAAVEEYLQGRASLEELREDFSKEELGRGLKKLEADSEALEALEIGDSASLREALRETAKALGADIAGQPAEEAPSAKKGAAEAASAGGAEGKGTKEDKHSRGKQAGEAQAR